MPNRTIGTTSACHSSPAQRRANADGHDQGGQQRRQAAQIGDDLRPVIEDEHAAQARTAPAYMPQLDKL